MTVTMSSEGDNSKNLSSQNNEKSEEETPNKSTENVKDTEQEKKPIENNTEKSQDDKTPEKEQETSGNKDDNIKDNDETPKTNDVPDKTNSVKENDEPKKEEEGTEEESGKDEESDKDDKKDVPLLDQPLEQSGKRERKNVQRFSEGANSEAKEPTKVEIPNGSGTPLGNIPRIDASISRFKNDDMKLLHRLLFKTPGKSFMIKKNIQKFNGFDFKKGSDEYQKKIASTSKYEVKQLKSICEMLDLQKSGTKDEIVERIIDFLLEPKDSGKAVGGGRPKRTAAVKANNRGYSSHDNYSSDERHSGRSGRDKGKRTNLKDESSSQSDEDFHPSDASDEKPRVKRRRRDDKKKVDSEEEEEESEEIMESGTSEEEEESDDEPKRRKKVTKPNNKTKGKTPAKRGRKPAATATAKKTKAAKKKSKETSEEEEEDEESDQKNNAFSSSEDEPLAKKAKAAQFPTDDELRSYIKEILEGANLEQITMKTVCQQVYNHYPDFDLCHKKDFIKSTVRSVIN